MEEGAGGGEGWYCGRKFLEFSAPNYSNFFFWGGRREQASSRSHDFLDFKYVASVRNQSSSKANGIEKQGQIVNSPVKLRETGNKKYLRDFSMFGLERNL